MRQVRFIGAASGRGARNGGCADGPHALAGTELVRELARRGMDAEWHSTIDIAPPPVDVYFAHIDYCGRLARVVQAVLGTDGLPVVMGGDHACAIGTWSGARAALPGPLGLIWVDAHMDSHVPETSPSGALHGMPLACLLGRGPEPLIAVDGDPRKVSPQHVCVIGVRSYEPEEASLLQELGVRVYFMDEVRRRGLAAVWADALERVCVGTAAYGISIDLDAVDPEDAPGVGTPVAGGIEGRELIATLAGVAADGRCAGLEIAEYNPHLDPDGRTLQYVRQLILSFLSRSLP